MRWSSWLRCLARRWNRPGICGRLGRWSECGRGDGRWVGGWLCCRGGLVVGCLGVSAGIVVGVEGCDVEGGWRWRAVVRVVAAGWVRSILGVGEPLGVAIGGFAQ